MVSAARQVQSLLGVDALLAMGGIIPSVSLFREQMHQRIVRLDASLAASGWTTEQISQICALLCRRLDARIAAALARNQQQITAPTLEMECYRDLVPAPESDVMKLMRPFLLTPHSDDTLIC